MSGNWKGNYKNIIIIGNVLIYIENLWEWTNKWLELVGEINKTVFKGAGRKTYKK